jgi:hypothetical protein
MKILLFIALCFLLACQRTPETINLSRGQQPQKIEQKVSISIDSTTLSIPMIFNLNCWHTKDINDTVYAFFANSKTNEFEVYNVEAGQSVWGLPIKTLFGSDGYPGSAIQSIEFISLDTILLLKEEQVILFNKDGIFYEQSINQETKKNNYKEGFNYYLVSRNVSSKWDAVRKGFWLRAACYNASHIKKPEIHYSSAIEIFLPADSTAKWDTLPTTYPPRYQTKCNHAWLDLPHRAISPTSHVYSFSAESDIYVYDIATKTYTSRPARSQYDTTDFPCLDKKNANSDDRLQHFNLSPQYQDIIYDPYRDCYYRVFAHGLPEKNAKGFYNDINDKEKSLMVFDKDFKLITEWKIPEFKYILDKIGVGKKGLYLLSKRTNFINSNHVIQINIINFVLD